MEYPLDIKSNPEYLKKTLPEEVSTVKEGEYN